MRKIIVVESLSLDGVMQAPGGSQEDLSQDFKFGGWLVPYFDHVVWEAVGETYARPYDLLLGRRTYDIFAGHWPKVASDPNGLGLDEGEVQLARDFDACTKYVATHFPNTLEWRNSKSLGSDIVQSLQKLKTEEGKTLLVPGSCELVHTLLAHNLVDELHLHIVPIVLGKGKRLFAENSTPSSFKLIRSAVSDNGTLLMNYSREGEVKMGSFAI